MPSVMPVSYATVGGRMVREVRSSILTRYVSDPLGSVVQTLNSAGTQTSSAAYWPFGEIRSSSGTNPSPWGFVGTLGYYKDVVDRLYVRARMLKVNYARWMTVDPLWPGESAYEYAGDSPVNYSDPSGLKVNIDCGGRSELVRKHLADVCKNRVSQLPAGPMKTCMLKKCKNISISCAPKGDKDCKPRTCGVTPGGYGTYSPGFKLCPDAFNPKIGGCLGKTILHEMCHACAELGMPAGMDPEKYCEGLAVGTYGPGKKPCPK